MVNRWNEKEAAALNGDPLELRVYSSRLLGQEEDLVLHGGGNTSVKIRQPNLFGEAEDILFVKGSGWDLATIEKQGFSPVRLDVLLKMAELEALSDTDMVSHQRAAMTDPHAPNPSVEAILHAIIPFKFVDHSHADAVVTISNTPDGSERIRSVYGDRVLVVPYVMPGFILAREIYRLTRGMDWMAIEGIMLMHHGVFTFADTAKDSYDKMIELVSEAEDYLDQQGAATIGRADHAEAPDTLQLSRIRQAVGHSWGKPVLVRTDNSPESIHFSNLDDLDQVSQRGPVTPDHIIRTKRTPLIIEEDIKGSVTRFRENYIQYFERHTNGGLQCLDPAPRWAVWPGYGTLAFGDSPRNTQIISDIARHTRKAIQQAEQLAAWTALPEKELFDMEYWELEQAKLAGGGTPKSFQGKVALVTGAASGIGRACVEELTTQGAVVAALDISEMDKREAGVLALHCDVTDKISVQEAVDRTVREFGGLDIVISNAGIFPASRSIREMDDQLWSDSLEVNLTSHRRLMTASIPCLEQGFDPCFIIIGSKNVLAPGPGAGAYSVAKAGLTQLGRIASLELGERGIRVNVIHPNAVYDTAIWTDDVLRSRAEHYGISVEEYKTNNVLGLEVTSRDVAALAAAMAGPVFGKTTGAQVPIDGGNDRVI
jgi:rhamnose utilization protein RhaD (predicted bifunctional aldolase and dehydrogenase)/NAD(P)-dependent dehydrogenase (short-subunit alcohol dehydrogenase family)